MSGRIGKTFTRALGIAAATAFATGPTMTLAQQEPVGISAAIQNSAQIRRGAARPRPAVIRERVLLNDQVLTGANSRLQIVLLDRSTFTVGSNAAVAIDRFVYDPARNARTSGVSVTRGAFRFMSGRALRRPAGPVSVRTPVASIGIRGTIVEGVVGADAVQIASGQAAVGPDVRSDPETATLILLRGPGPRTQGDTIPGAVDILVQNRTIALEGTNMALYVPGPGLAPIGPFKISSEGLMGFQSLLRTTPAFAATAAQTAGQGIAGAGAAAGSAVGVSGGGGGRVFLFGLGGIAAAVFAILAAGSGGNSDEDEPGSP
jgi:hypothetical protein